MNRQASIGKYITALLIISIFILGCQLSLPIRIRVPGAQVTGAPGPDLGGLVDQMRQATQAALGPAPLPSATTVPTPTPKPVYKQLIPYAAAPVFDPSQGWQLIPQESEEDNKELNYTVQVQIPYVEHTGASRSLNTFASDFNQQVQTLVRGEIDQIRETLGSTPVEGLGGFIQVTYAVTSAAGWKMSDNPYLVFGGPAALTSDQAFFSSGHALLSVEIEVFTYMGGEHPAAYHLVVNYDLTTGKALDLSGLFKPGSNSLDTVANYCIDQLSKRKDKVFPEFAENASAKAENYRVWNITPAGLLITFEEYQVAPYAAGPQQVLVPYDALAPVLDPAGPLSAFAR